MNTGAVLGGVTGIVNYSFGNYEVLPDRPAVLVPEIEAIEQHLARLIDDLLG